MANTTTSPNMNLPVPVPGVDPGPDWATNIVADMYAIDSHNHSSGQGVAIGPNGININADLPFNSNNATALRTTRFVSQSASLSDPSDLGCAYVVGGDFYYNDGAGNIIRITQSGSVTGATGTITGLPSGTASASYATGTFSFQSATNTPATINVGPLVMGAQSASPHTVTLSAGTMAADYALVWPTSAPSLNQALVSDGSGNLSWVGAGFLPIGSVIATFPNLSGAYTTTATTTADAHGFVLCTGQTISDGSSPMNGQVVPNLNNSVFLRGSTTAGTAGGSATSTGYGAHTHTFTSAATIPAEDHTHVFSHTHQWGVATSSGNYFYTKTASSPSSTDITVGDQLIFGAFGATISGGAHSFMYAIDVSSSMYTAGAISAPAGSGSTAATAGASGPYVSVAGTTDSSGSSFAIIPPYISAVYLMRVK